MKIKKCFYVLFCLVLLLSLLSTIVSAVSFSFSLPSGTNATSWERKSNASPITGSVYRMDVNVQFTADSSSNGTTASATGLGYSNVITSPSSFTVPVSSYSGSYIRLRGVPLTGTSNYVSGVWYPN